MNCHGLVLKGTNPRACASCREKGLAGIAVLSCRRADETSGDTGGSRCAGRGATVPAVNSGQFLGCKAKGAGIGSDDHVGEGSNSMRKCFALLLIGLTVLPPAIQGQQIPGSDVNGILYVTPIGGSDLGAQINAAAGGCTTGSQCQIVVVPGAQTSFSTGIVYVANE